MSGFEHKKRKGILGFDYGLFLVTRIASTAPMMIMTTTIATIPYISVLFEAKPVSGDAVGAGVAAGLPA